MAKRVISPAFFRGATETEKVKSVEDVVYDYLGTREAPLVKAWFEKLQSVARTWEGEEVHRPGPITWEDVR